MRAYRCLKSCLLRQYQNMRYWQIYNIVITFFDDTDVCTASMLIFIPQSQIFPSYTEYMRGQSTKPLWVDSCVKRKYNFQTNECLWEKNPVLYNYAHPCITRASELCFVFILCVIKYANESPLFYCQGSECQGCSCWLYWYVKDERQIWAQGMEAGTHSGR